MKNKESKNQNNRNEISSVEREGTDRWWARLSPGRRMLAQQIAVMIEEVTDTKRIEIRRERQGIIVRFIHLLKNPEKGCVTAIVVPEQPASLLN